MSSAADHKLPATDLKRWRAAIATPAETSRFHSQGAQLSLRRWLPFEAHKPLLLFAHGYRGHSHWWDWTAPEFTDRFRVAAFDFSGMGDSEWRDRYDGQLFIQDLFDALDFLSARDATVVGHSFGGTTLLRACSEQAVRALPRRIGHAIAVDSWVRFPDRDPPIPTQRKSFRLRHASRADALQRYRLNPLQPNIHELLAHLAHQSMIEIDGGWYLKTDPKLPMAANDIDGPKVLAAIDCPVDFIYGSRSTIVQPWRAAAITQHIPNCQPPYILDGAYHHPMICHPDAFSALLRARLESPPRSDRRSTV